MQTDNGKAKKSRRYLLFLKVSLIVNVGMGVLLGLVLWLQPHGRFLYLLKLNLYNINSQVWVHPDPPNSYSGAWLKWNPATRFPLSIQIYKNGSPDGAFVYFNDEGVVSRIQYYADSRMVSGVSLAVLKKAADQWSQSAPDSGLPPTRE